MPLVQALIAQLRAPSKPSPNRDQCSIAAWSWSPRQRQHGPPVGTVVRIPVQRTP